MLQRKPYAFCLSFSFNILMNFFSYEADREGMSQVVTHQVGVPGGL